MPVAAKMMVNDEHSVLQYDYTFFFPYLEKSKEIVLNMTAREHLAFIQVPSANMQHFQGKVRTQWKPSFNFFLNDSL